MKYRLSILSCFFVVAQGMAQSINSPYSSYAPLGELEDGFVNRTTGMGSTGIAYRHHRNIILNNPASLSALDNQFFAGEIGVQAKYDTYSGSPVGVNNTSADINFRRFTLGTKIFKHMGSAIGLAPYSNENYESTRFQAIGVSGAVIPQYKQGFGGVNKVFWANGYEFFNHLSVGVTFSYLFGSNNIKTIQQGGTSTAFYISQNDNTFYNNLYLDYGLQYHGALSKRWDYSVGLIYANKSDLNSQTDIYILNSDSVMLKSTTNTGTFTIPTSYGGGLALTKDKKYTFLADYKYQNWASQQSTNPARYTYGNSQRASVGFEISQLKSAYNALYETSFFQAGAYFNRSYLIINGKPIDDMGLSVGFGVNAKRSPLSCNVVLQYGIKGTTQNNQIKESYVGATFIFAYRDFWLTHGRRFD